MRISRVGAGSAVIVVIAMAWTALTATRHEPAGASVAATTEQPAPELSEEPPQEVSAQAAKAEAEAEPAPEQPAEAAAEPDRVVEPGHGAVTNLPLPRYVSLKGTEGNARRGPSLSQRIDWVFTRRGMPLQITAEFENWRLVQDKDGAGGWVHYTLLSGTRSVVIETDMTPLYSAPDERARVMAMLQTDVVGRVSECTQNWCRISAGSEKGWVQKSALWGVGPQEVLN